MTGGIEVFAHVSVSKYILFCVKFRHLRKQFNWKWLTYNLNLYFRFVVDCIEPMVVD